MFKFFIFMTNNKITSFGKGYSKWSTILDCDTNVLVPETGLYFFECLADNHIEFALVKCKKDMLLGNIYDTENSSNYYQFPLNPLNPPCNFHFIPLYSPNSKFWKPAKEWIRSDKPGRMYVIAYKITGHDEIYYAAAGERINRRPDIWDLESFKPLDICKEARQKDFNIRFRKCSFGGFYYCGHHPDGYFWVRNIYDDKENLVTKEYFYRMMNEEAYYIRLKTKEKITKEDIENEIGPEGSLEVLGMHEFFSYGLSCYLNNQ